MIYNCSCFLATVTFAASAGYKRVWCIVGSVREKIIWSGEDLLFLSPSFVRFSAFAEVIFYRSFCSQTFNIYFSTVLNSL